MAKRLRIGDVFVISLPDGRYAYGHYLFRDDQNPHGLGCIIRVFDIITDQTVDVEELRDVQGLFPPVSVGLLASIRSGRWKVIGHIPVERFEYPQFRYTYGFRPGTYHDWRIWDGKEFHLVGDLTDEQRRLELMVTWGDEHLEERIATGINPYDRIL